MGREASSSRRGSLSRVAARRSRGGTTRRGEEILAVARRLLERDGADGLSLRRIADEVGIRAPSIYNHFPDKEALEAALIAEGFGEWSGRFEAARREADARSAFAATYRAFAAEHPHLYRLMTERPLPRTRLDPSVEARAARHAVEAAGDDPNRARALWAFAHGMTILELNGRFPAGADLDAAWRHGLDAFGAG